MREQIETGVYNAIQDATDFVPLAELSDAEATAIVDAVLAALSQTPEGTPEPGVIITPAATPMLVLSPADVVARYAMDALTDIQARETVDTDQIIHESWGTGTDIRQVREMLFRIQGMFGVRVRVNAARSTLLVAGTEPQVRAFQRVVMMLRDSAESVVATLTADEQKVFYATLGTLIADHDDADHLFESNRDMVARATDYLNAEFGPARNLPRTTPATGGDIYASAMMVAPVRLPVN